MPSGSGFTGNFDVEGAKKYLGFDDKKILRNLNLYSYLYVTQHFYCVMIPSFKIIPGSLFPLLPVGIHEATIAEVELRYAGTPHRKDLFNGLIKGLNNLFESGCPQAFLDGSFITAKPKPNDYEVCWDPRFVDPSLLDPVFLDFSFGTTFQKLKYKGEYFPSTATERGSGKSFLDFFQIDKETGKQKGIIKIKNYLPGGGTI